jgi:hypothetical protein
MIHAIIDHVFATYYNARERALRRAKTSIREWLGSAPMRPKLGRWEKDDSAGTSWTVFDGFGNCVAYAHCESAEGEHFAAVNMPISRAADLRGSREQVFREAVDLLATWADVSELRKQGSP